MSMGAIAAYILAAGLLVVLCILFRRALKDVLVMVLHSALGGAGLWLCNILLAPLGFGIGLNIATAAVCGMLGLPGLILLLLLKALCMYM